MKKAIINIGLIFTFFIIYFLQANFFSWFTIAGIMPNLFVIFILFIGLFAHKYMGMAYGVFLGIILDLLISKKIGITAIMLGVVGIIGNILDKNFSKENRVTIIIMVALSTAIFEIGLYIFGFFIYDTQVEIKNFIIILLTECLYNVLITIIIYPLIQIAGNKIEEEYKGNRILTRYF